MVSIRSNQIITLNNLPTLRALLVIQILARLDFGPKEIDRFYLEASVMIWTRYRLQSCISVEKNSFIFHFSTSCSFVFFVLGFHG